MGLIFELKGGASLSKGFQIINRFSEDIDIRIEPPPGRDVKTGRNQTKSAHIESRKEFYDWLATIIHIDGITKVERDTAFDNKDMFSAGIRLFYNGVAAPLGRMIPEPQSLPTDTSHDLALGHRFTLPIDTRDARSSTVMSKTRRTGWGTDVVEEVRKRAGERTAG